MHTNEKGEKEKMTRTNYHLYWLPVFSGWSEDGSPMYTMIPVKGVSKGHAKERLHYGIRRRITK